MNYYLRVVEAQRRGLGGGQWNRNPDAEPVIHGPEGSGYQGETNSLAAAAGDAGRAALRQTQ